MKCKDMPLGKKSKIANQYDIYGVRVRAYVGGKIELVNFYQLDPREDIINGKRINIIDAERCLITSYYDWFLPISRPLIVNYDPFIKGNIWKGFVLGLLTNKGLSLENGLSFLRENFSFIPSPIFVDI